MMIENSAIINFDILPDEHLLGALGRFHHLSSYRLISKSLSGVTFDIKSLCPHAFNRNIFKDLHHCMTNRDNELLSFLKPNTLVNFYQPFAPDKLFYSKTPIAILPRANNVFKRSKNWQWCPSCVTEDIDTFGVPYFHVEHQLPAMFHCYKHKTPLLIRCDACIKYRDNIELIGVPPQPGNCDKCFGNVDEECTFLDDDIRWLNETSLKLLNSDEEPFNLLELQAAYQQWIGVGPIKGQRTVAEKKKIKKAQVELESAFSPKLFSVIFKNPYGVLSKRVVNTLHIPTASFHPNYFVSPIVHLLIIRMMFGDIENIPLIN